MNNEELQSEFRNVVIEDDNINFGITINSVGYKSILPNIRISKFDKIDEFNSHYKKGRVSNEFKLIYITKGVGFVRFDDSNEMEISEGKILLITLNQIYTYYHLSNYEWKEYFIRFETDDAFNLLIRKFFPVEKSMIDIGFNEELTKLFK